MRCWGSSPSRRGRSCGRVGVHLGPLPSWWVIAGRGRVLRLPRRLPLLLVPPRHARTLALQARARVASPHRHAVGRHRALHASGRVRADGHDRAHRSARRRRARRRPVDLVRAPAVGRRRRATAGTIFRGARRISSRASDGARHHDFHHARVRGNYAGFFPIWDRRFGTLLARVTGRRSPARADLLGPTVRACWLDDEWARVDAWPSAASHPQSTSNATTVACGSMSPSGTRTTTSPVGSELKSSSMIGQRVVKSSGAPAPDAPSPRARDGSGARAP